jgi:beta-glucanase (GH16 family)
VRLRAGLVTANGTVRLPAQLAGAKIQPWRVVLQKTGASAGSWSALASTGLPARAQARRFAISWKVPSTASALVVRVAVVLGRRLLVATRSQKLVVAPAPPAGAAQKCGGELPPREPGGGSWTCSFDDEFDATTGDANALNRSWWVPQVTGNSGFETGPLPLLAAACYEDSPQTISVANGVLQLTVRRAPSPMLCAGELTDYVGGMVTTYQRFTQAYGRYEVRAQLPAATTRGLQETLWLWPANDTLYGSWPRSGEIDFGEFFSDQPSVDIPYVHYDFSSLSVSAITDTNVVTSPGCPIIQGQYNDYAVTWEPGKLTMTVNGAICVVDNYVPNGGLGSPAPFDQPFFIALTQALGSGANAFNPIHTPLPATTSIDYVRVWRSTP